MNYTVKRLLQILVSFGLAGFFLYLAMRDTDFQSVGRALVSAHYLYGIPVMLCWVAIQLLRIERFGVLIEPFAGKRDFATLFRIGNIGMFAVFALPLRLGELVRPYMLKREFGAPMSASMGAVAAERVIDGLVVTLGFFVVTQASASVPQNLAYAGFLALCVFAGAAFTLGAVLIFGQPAAQLVERILSVISPRLGKRISDMLLAFAQGLRSLSSLPKLTRYLGSTLAFWALNGVSNWFVFKALHIDQSLIVAYILVALTVVALMIPAGPGMVGAAQAAVVSGLVAYGCDQATAVAYAISAHLLGAVVTVAFGLLSLAMSQTKMGKLVEDANASGV